ncbi:hypothetical protein SAMN04488550_1112 [Gordonia malaquae]|nr:hypothetical protein SAMN04488550_1112 [Gordonia malaquae]
MDICIKSIHLSPDMFAIASQSPMCRPLICSNE